MYSSGGDLHLELPTGQQGGTRKLWVSSHLLQLSLYLFGEGLFLYDFSFGFFLPTFVSCHVIIKNTP